ncbi:hypothetical protein DFH07DRAFT_817099 [Mycena maculata]|uniref:Protein kinase domain-containing protein n=1 Tax=Mycena maculata TaxID=230809 RepID=A0AAD7JCL8_9AGAR|nr:hypothetical protein DFH07DRAFT_817099 [Mycena maculata]
MDDRRPQNLGFGCESTIDYAGSTPYAGAFFPRSKYLVVAGGTFTSNTNNTTPSPVPSDYRKIPMGDIDLRQEIRFDEDSHVVYRRSVGGSVRRMYSARVNGQNADMTVALYEGDCAEKHWRQDITEYARFRHPNFVQLYGVASSHGLHAAVFHDGLIPVKRILEMYRSPVSVVYLWGYLDEEFRNARDYFYTLSASRLRCSRCTTWIRLSSGRLCVDFTNEDPDPLFILYSTSDMLSRSVASRFFRPHEVSDMIASTSLDYYHTVCFLDLAQSRHISISAPTSVHLRSIIRCPVYSEAEFEDPVQIAHVHGVKFEDSGWIVSKSTGATSDKDFQIMKNGWTRVHSSQLSDAHIGRIIDASGRESKAWLAQANHIFNRFGITSNHEDYLFAHLVCYRLKFRVNDNLPHGYLFLCPLEDLQSNTNTSFQHPTCPAYWSLDASGILRLSAEKAEEQGFPYIELTTEVQGRYWDSKVYAGLREFHQSKTFDPETQEVARELGYPFYEISCEGATYGELT